MNQKIEIFSLSLYLHQTLKRTILNEIWVKIFRQELWKDKTSKSEHFQRLHENVSKIAARWSGDCVTSMLVFRAEKRSAQASEHRSSRQ